MKLYEQIKDIRAAIRKEKQNGKAIGFVPTMGNLHEGHLSLVNAAKVKADLVVASIFVNPKQFGPNEDFAAYPRTLEADCEKLKAQSTDLLFLPNTETLYPEGADSITQVRVPKLSEHQCGAHRPGHFTGVATVVTKLFNIVEPDFAIFGEKDYQQVAVIRKMAKDLNMSVEIISHPTVRETDGLALSSRNAYLSAQERKAAPHLYAALTELKAQFEKETRHNLRALEKNAYQYLQEHGFKPDYVSICDANTLELAKDTSGPLHVLVAAYLGTTRLIDNIHL